MWHQPTLVGGSDPRGMFTSLPLTKSPFAEYSALTGVTISRALSPQDYDMLEFDVMDLNGHRLAFALPNSKPGRSGRITVNETESRNEMSTVPVRPVAHLAGIAPQFSSMILTDRFHTTVTSSASISILSISRSTRELHVTDWRYI